MKLLVPLDGSDLSEIVYPWVRLLGSEVELLRSYLPIEQLHLGYGLPIAVSRLANDEGEDVHIRSYLNSQAGKLAPLKVETCCNIGHPAETILDHASPHDAIVMASHGARGITRWLLGSVTTKVVRASTKPVLVISARPDPKVRPAKLEHIFVPLDGSKTAEVALRKAVELGHKHKAKLTLYQGVPFHAEIPEFQDWGVNAAKAYLSEKAGEIHGLEVEVVAYESESGVQIVEQADLHEADMIVMGSHGRSGVSRWILGSVTERVIQRSNCPVLIVYDRE